MSRDAWDDEIRQALRALAPQLDRFRVSAPSAELVRQTFARARQELAAQRLPVGFRRELAKLLLAALPAFGLVLAWNAFFLPRLPGFLEALLPTPLAVGLAFAYAAAAAAWLAFAAGCLPFFAHQRARLREAF
jgi:hypothetical protein